MKESKQLKEIISILKKHNTSDKTINELKKTMLFQKGLVPILYGDVLDVIRKAKRLETNVFTVPSNTKSISDKIKHIKDIKKAKGVVASIVLGKDNLTMDRISDLLGNLVEGLKNNTKMFWSSKCNKKLKNNIKIGYIYSF